MKIARTPLAVLVLVACSTAFAGDSGTGPASTVTACQKAKCVMDRAKTAPPAPVATGSWYLPTWEETAAATNGAQVCDEARDAAPPTSAAPIRSSWYLPTWEEVAATAAEAMACCEAPCPMDSAAQAKPTPAGKAADSWYLPS